MHMQDFSKRPNKEQKTPAKEDQTHKSENALTQWAHSIMASIPTIKISLAKLFVSKAHANETSTNKENPADFETTSSVNTEIASNSTIKEATPNSENPAKHESSPGKTTATVFQNQHIKMAELQKVEMEDSTSSVESKSVHLKLVSDTTHTHAKQFHTQDVEQSNNENLNKQHNASPSEAVSTDDTMIPIITPSEAVSTDDTTIPIITPQEEAPPTSLVVDESKIKKSASVDVKPFFSSDNDLGIETSGKKIKVKYALNLSEQGADSGLQDTDGNSILLFSNSQNKVEGRTGGEDGPAVFTTMITKKGILKLSLHKALKHSDPTDSDDSVGLTSNDLIQAIKTTSVKGESGTQGVDTLNVGEVITFKDSGPSLKLKATRKNKLEKIKMDETDMENVGTADYSDNFSAKQFYGADGKGSFSSEYSLSLKTEGADSGLTDLVTNNSVLLYTVGDHIEGRVEDMVVFKLSVDPYGTVSLSQERALEHIKNKAVSIEPDAGILLSRTDTVFDSDGDQASKTASFNIGSKLIFADDKPIITQISDPNENGVIEVNAFNPSSSVEHPLALLNWSYGQDTAGDVPIQLVGSRGNVSLESSSSDQVALTFKDKAGMTVAKLTLHQDGTDTLALMHRNGNKLPNLKFTAKLLFTDQDGSTQKQVVKLFLDKDGALSTSGFTLDGSPSDVSVFQDIDYDTTLDSGEISVLTDQQGAFNLMVHDANQDGILNHRDGRLVSLGGTDTETGECYLLPLYAPVGSSVITPLTSVLQMQLEGSSDPIATKAALNLALGFHVDTEIMHTNPITLAESGDTTIMQQAAAIMTLSTQLGAATAGLLDTSDVMVAHGIYHAIGDEILKFSQEGGSTDFTDPALIHQIVINVADQYGLSPEQYEPIMGLMLESQSDLIASLDNLDQNADPIEALSDAQHVTQGSYVDSITHLYSPNAGKDFTFTTTHSDLSENILDHVDVIPSEASLTQISFETDNAADYVMEQGVPQANADSDGTTVHIDVPADGSDISFITPAGAIMTINSTGEFNYNTDNIDNDAVDNFSYTFQINDTHQMKTSFIEINVIDNHKTFSDVEGGDGDDVLSSANHNADVVALKGHGGHNSYEVNISEINPPEKIMIMDLGISKANVLSFTGVSDADHSGDLSLSDVVDNFHQDQPNGDVTMTLHNQSTLVLHNVGTVQGSDVQALEQHLQAIAQEVNIQ